MTMGLSKIAPAARDGALHAFGAGPWSILPGHDLRFIRTATLQFFAWVL